VSRTLALHAIREVLTYAALSALVLGVVFLGENLRRYLDLLVAVDFAPGDVVALLKGLTGLVASHVLPITFLLGTLLTVGRMTADAEITAMRSCGIGLRALLVPILGLAVLVTGLTWLLVVNVEHQARRELRSVVQGMATRGTAIEPGHFRSIGSRVLYAEDRRVDDDLHGVLVSDRSDPKRPMLVFAERGRVALDQAQGRLRVSLDNGDILVDPVGEDPAEAQHIAFQTFDTSFDVRELFRVAFSALRPYDMTLDELRALAARADAGDPLDDVIKKRAADYRVEMHRRFAVPFAPLLFAPIGVALGMRGRRGARSAGVLLCALVAFGYYTLLTFGQMLGVEGRLPAPLALWIPNLLFAALGVGLLEATRRSRS
jgi:lipopolysaccharide export system permease protein